MLVLATGFKTFHAAFRRSRGDYGKVILRGSRVTDVVMAWEGQLLIRLEEDCSHQTPVADQPARGRAAR
jgi:hypothetical protein